MQGGVQQRAQESEIEANASANEQLQVLVGDRHTYRSNSSIAESFETLAS